MGVTRVSVLQAGSKVFPQLLLSVHRRGLSIMTVLIRRARLLQMCPAETGTQNNYWSLTAGTEKVFSF